MTKMYKENNIKIASCDDIKKLLEKEGWKVQIEAKKKVTPIKKKDK